MKIRVIPLSIVAVLTALLLSLPSQVVADSQTASIVRMVKPAVVQVFTYDKSGKKLKYGTGFFVSAEGDVVTCWHVMVGATRAMIRTSQGIDYPVSRIIAEDQKGDLVKIGISGNVSSLPFLSMAPSPPSEGDPILVIGNPEAFAWTISDGVVSGFRQFPDIGSVLQITAPISPGSSGAPVVNMDGQVVGVVDFYWAEGQNLNFAIPASRVMALGGQVAVDEAYASLNAASMLADENYLAGDETQGRRSGTKGCDLAAAYIARQFKGAGLVAPVDGSYFLPFPITTAVKLGGGNVLSVKKPTGAKTFAVEKDFMPLIYSANESVSGPVVFAGYGISAPDYKYDDYAGIDAKGKVVVVLRYQPQIGNDKSAFNGGKVTRFADIRYKAANAHQHGAAAMILVTGPAGGHEGDGNDLIKLKNDFTMGDEGLPVMMVTRPVGDAILDKPVADAQKPIEDTLNPNSYIVPFTSASVTTDVVKEKGTTSDVIGCLPGTDPKLKDEVIVLGAHYDHLGLGGQGSLAPDQEGKIHHGADDNASGTTCLIEIAKALAKERANIRRTFVFIAFSGEEEGLLGSGYYVEHPIWPLKNTVTMLNMDMVGRLHEDKLVVSGYKSATEFDGWLKEANARLGFNLAEDASGYEPSDQTSFLAKDIPVLFFFTGAHEDYHRPTDTVDKLNFPGMLRVAQYVLLIAADVDEADARPTFDKSSQGRPPSMGGGGGYGPYLGTIPDFGESTVPGVRITGVGKGSPAEKAGLQGGDIIVKFGDAEIRNLYDLFNALQNHKVGDVVEIVYKRGDKTFTTKATLEKRKEG